MQEYGKAAHYFISAHTPTGFVSRLPDLYSARDGWRAYILKGGPGTGKTRVMEKVGEAARSLGMNTEYLHCTSDGASLDGVVVNALKTCVIDGTPPHAVEPRFPGAVETILNLGDCWDEDKLAQEHERIILFGTRASACYDRSYRFLSAAAAMQGDTARFLLDCTDNTKIERYATRVAKREFAVRRRQGHECVRFLTGITPEGVVCYHETAEAMNKVFVIEDEFGVGKLLLGRLRTCALQAGYDVVSCYCPMAPTEKLEHLIIPSLSLAFVTSNHFHSFEGKGYRHIHIRRFIDSEAVRLRHARIQFNRRATRELITEAVKLLHEAKANTDVLRSIYSAAMDFAAVDRCADALAEKIVHT